MKFMKQWTETNMKLVKKIWVNKNKPDNKTSKDVEVKWAYGSEIDKILAQDERWRRA